MLHKLSVLPILIFLVILYFLYSGLSKDPTLIPSPLIGKITPSFASVTLLDNQKIKVTISGGGAFTSESLNISDLVNKADERLYLSKKNGRNKFYLKED